MNQRFAALLFTAALALRLDAQVIDPGLMAILPAPSHLFSPDDALAMNTYSINDMTDDGKWLAMTMSVRRDGFGTDFSRDGDPTYVRPALVRAFLIDAATRTRVEIFPEKRAVKSLRFSPDGSKVAMLLWSGEMFEPAIYDRATKRVTTLHAPNDRYVAETSDLRWSGDGTSLVFAMHTTDWKKKAQARFKQITGGPVFVQSSKDPFLAWDDLRRMGNTRSVGSIDIKTGNYRELVPEGMISSYTLAEDGSAVTFTEDLTRGTSYETGTNDGRSSTRFIATGTTKVLFASTRGITPVWAEDGKRFAFARDGRVFVASVEDTTPKFVVGPPPSAAGRGAAADSGGRGAAGRGRGAIGGGRGADSAGGRGSAPARDTYSVSRFNPRGDLLLVSNREGQWIVDIATGVKELAMPAADSTSTLPRTTVAAWSDDGSQLYFTTAARTKWERSVVRYDRASKQRTELVKDGRTYSGIRLAKDGSRLFMTVAEGNRPPEIFSASADLGDLKRFILSNPQLEGKRFGPTELMRYLDADGQNRYAVVHYPTDYQRGTAYPTVFIIYEEYFDDTWDANANILAAAGYVVVKPSVGFETGFPGEAWLKGVTAAANKLIELGVSDSTRLGVQGQSYGGYATNLLVTQTKRFRAAINISGKVDLISFYTDSPRLGVRNITAAERSQDRIGATMWEQPQKYIQHSAVLFADRITTPLMLITGNWDSNVPADNTREMYYALRRLGKEVTWVNYMRGGHGGGNATADEYLDMQHRILGWYEEKLKRTKR
jgi:dipeptidyl aminopeptidase/acylaminoacyl peptidase